MRPLSALLALLGSGASVATSSAYQVVLRTKPGLRRQRAVIVDDEGRERILRGINVATMGKGLPFDPAEYDGRCPEDDEAWYQPPICQVDAGKGKYAANTSDAGHNDLAQIRNLGFEVIRLLVHWSEIEPKPGNYSSLYLNRLKQIVSWAEEQDLKVIIDFHQDNYARKFHACCADDGAPDWAILDNETTLPAWQREEAALMTKIIPQLDWQGAEVAFRNFWQNMKVPQSGKGLQEHYIGAVAAVARHLDTSPAVIGYEIMNEPLPGLDIRLLHFSGKLLYPFYRRAIQALTGERDGMQDCPVSSPVGLDCAYPDLGIHSSKLMFFEPMALRNQLDVSLQVSKPFSKYKNLVYAPHTYTDSFTLQKHVGNGSFLPPNYAFALDTAQREADAMNAATFVTEFGGATLERSEKIVAEQDRHLVSSTWWLWKQNGGGGWGLFDHSPSGDKIRAERIPVVSRIYPRATAGSLLSFSYDPPTAAFSMSASCVPNTPECTGAPTLVYVPAHVVADAVVQGAATLTHVDSSPDGSRILTVTPSAGGGTYTVTIGDAAVLVAAAIEQQDESLVQDLGQSLEALAQAVKPESSILAEALMQWSDVHLAHDVIV